jgi:hypothetical protein
LVCIVNLDRNPNAYFYRHVEKGVEQWLGDWREDEIETFLTVAREFGCGDKWGLFSSHIPHRVGYQCANFYRTLLAQGLINDPNYRFGAGGVVVYCPKSKPSSN